MENKANLADHLLTTPRKITRTRLQAATQMEGEIPEDIFDHWMSLGVEAYTYFAKGLWTGRIKIGRSTDPWRRVNELIGVRNGEEAELLCALRGRHLERKYHNRFAEYHDGNEWFTPAPDILAEIERLNTGANQ